MKESILKKKVILAVDDDPHESTEDKHILDRIK
jgi:hypothetical protein